MSTGVVVLKIFLEWIRDLELDMLAGYKKRRWDQKTKRWVRSMEYLRFQVSRVHPFLRTWAETCRPRSLRNTPSQNYIWHQKYGGYIWVPLKLYIPHNPKRSVAMKTERERVNIGDKQRVTNEEPIFFYGRNYNILSIKSGQGGRFFY
jgi:hypothetical protein